MSPCRVVFLNTMGHEIYYTSCANGLRPHSRGLCTVGASDQIPPALWERLEALSGYRHHYDPEDPRNPIAFAHWILYIGGREHHVLSRICDSGFDYTRRNNSFAHHLALDADERPAAGPAWVLSQSGVMAGRWDGRVGPIHRPSPVPYGDSPPRPCSAWQRFAGDAGWAGVLVEAFVDHPSRPVSIIYSPEQSASMLPLIAEAIALLPAAQRWNVTFHTYFTSMPGNVQCNWRCCLADTHAATAARSATGAMVIDLSRPESLGAPPESPWVSRARSGSAAPAKSEPLPTVARLNPRAPAFSRKPAPIPLAEETPPAPAADLVDLPALQPPPLIPHLNEAPQKPVGQSAVRNLMLLYLLACVAVAVGIWLLVLAGRPTSNPEPLPVPVDRPPNPVTQEARVDTSVTPRTQNTVVRPPINHTAPITKPATTRRVDPPPMTRPRAEPCVLARSLERMASGSGIGSKPQVIPVPREAIDSIETLSRIALRFPGGQPEYAYKDANIVGRLWFEPEPSTPTGPGLSLHWKDTSGAGGKIKIVSLSFEKTGPRIHIAWNTSAMLRNPEVQVAAFWVLQNCQVVLTGAQNETVGRLNFKPLEPIDVKVLSAAPAIAFSADLPAGAMPRANLILPEGWTGVCEPEWDAANAEKKPPERATHVIRLKCEGAGDPGLTVTIHPGWSKVETDLLARRKPFAAAVERADAELALVNAEIQRTTADTRADLEPLEKKMSELEEIRKMPNAELEARGITRQFLTSAIHNLTVQIRQRGERHKEALNTLAPRKAEADRMKAEAEQVMGALNRLTGFEMDLELGDGLRVGRVKFDLSGR